MGCKDVLRVARSYGFKRVLSIEDIAYDDPTRFPFFHFPLQRLDPPIDTSAANK